MNVFILFTESGPLVILTSHASLEDPVLLEKLAGRGIDKFLGYSVPAALAKARYGMHFDIVGRDPSETDDLRVLDFDGTRAFHLFDFAEMTGPIAHEGAKTPRVGSLAAV